ncbi:DUF1996 domain-containing protein [Streptomyces albicerus]|uniref:DUF1996 domain-containing protein n=1 Tax=Streptomyces albicerus TaxID=2569859 RepID=UPI00124B605F|nr:DUF1996 domain-containing protein [Streptomyces albicerus]
MLGGGGLVAANVYATASESDSTRQSGQNQAGQVLASGAATIDCPDVGSQLTAVPDQAKTEVDGELALLDKQIAEAYQRLQNSAQAIEQDGGFADSAIMNPLKDKRAATIERISIAIDRVGDRPQGLEDFAACTLRASGNQPGQGDGQNGDQGGDGQDEAGDNHDGQDQGGGQDDGQNQGNDQEQGNQQGGNGGQAGNGPAAADFADITKVQPNVQNPNPQGDASRGTFTTSCGVNEGGLFNSDNVIVAPGVTNGAHHFHDYVGNQSNDAFASDEDLANADTSCESKDDKSSYFWPVLRLQNGTQEKDAASPGGGIEGNAGEIVTPKQVTMTFVGNPRSEVTEMPRLLRIITGDAKAFVNGTANANASWSCTGFENKVQLKDKYPLCPKGSDVVRTFKFQSCWDGRNIDSANHRTHVAFADAGGNCAGGFKAIPQLVQRIVYDVDAPSLQDGGRTTPLFAVDSFPEQLHKPVTDHGDFINVFDEELMREMVDCINGGRQCDAASGAGSGGGSDDGSGAGEEPGNTPSPTPDAPDTPSGTPDAPSGGNGQDEDPADNGGGDTPQPSTSSAQAPKPADGSDSDSDGGNAEPKADTSPSAVHSDPVTSGDSSDSDGGGAVPGPEPTPTIGGNDQSVAGDSEPQAVSGGLADTGTQLWPAAAGALLLITGGLLLRRIRHRQG